MAVIVRLELLHLAAQADEDLLVRQDLRRQRVIRDRSRAFELNDNQFKRLFRVKKNVVYLLWDRLSDRLSGNHALAIPVDTKVSLLHG